MNRKPAGPRWQQMRFAFAGNPEVSRTDVDGVGDAPYRPDAVRVHSDEPPAPSPGEHRKAPPIRKRASHPRTRSSLPVPRPLPEAIEAGHFGCEEDGRPVRPSRQEVREITVNHAEAMAEALREQQQETFEHGITQYAESFGPEAAERLRSYVHRLARESVAPPWRR